MESGFCYSKLFGLNYAHWKARAKVCLKAQGIRIWRSVVPGWKRSTKMNANNEEILKPEAEWTNVEIVETNLNTIALNTISNRLEEEQFTLIGLAQRLRKLGTF